MKLIVLYTQPEDTAAFDAEYAKHGAFVEKIPGLSSWSATRISKTLAGDGFYLMAEMIFPDTETFKAAMKSPEMAATGADANRFADGLMTMMIGNEIEE